MGSGFPCEKRRDGEINEKNWAGKRDPRSLLGTLHHLLACHWIRIATIVTHLFQERLSYKRGKSLRDNVAGYLYIITGMVVFTVAWVNHKVFECAGGKKQHKRISSFFLVPCCWITLNLNQFKTKLLLPINYANRHCGIIMLLQRLWEQPLSKQLYTSLFKPHPDM